MWTAQCESGLLAQKLKQLDSQSWKIGARRSYAQDTCKPAGSEAAPNIVNNVSSKAHAAREEVQSGDCKERPAEREGQL